jgi:DNA-binding protein H-NS
MAAVSLKNMDVDALLTLRADVGKALAERSRDLQRQLALLGGGSEKRRGRPPGAAVRHSAMKGVKVPPKYRGPGGETWAGRGATPRWLRALLDEGHSVEEFLIGRKGGKRAAATAKTANRKVTKKKAAKLVRKPRQPKESKTKAESAAA